MEINLTNQTNPTNPLTVDLFLFMGQSNMAGRGAVSELWPEQAPGILDHAGYEFRAISDPTRLYQMAEPFGKHENKVGGIDDGDRKTGSMVTAFTNAYYSNNGGVPVVGVSASKGGSVIAEWLPKGNYLTDAIQRFSDAVRYLDSHHYSIRHKYVLWCQGESDGDRNTSYSDYKAGFQAMLDELLGHGIEKLFMVRIGNCNIAGSEDRYTRMIQWQDEIAKENEDVVMVSTDFAGMRSRGLMKDSFHYYQAAYNEVGTSAGIHTAFYVKTNP